MYLQWERKEEPMKYPEHARRIKEALSDKEINAADLSRLSKINQSSLSQYINGTNKPNSLRAVTIASILEVNPLWLMGFDVPKYKEDVEKTKQQKYYLNNETATEAQKAFDDPNLRVLFDAADGATPENIQAAASFLNYLKGTNRDG